MKKLDAKVAAERNLALSQAFTRSLLEHPETLDDVPDGATIIFLPSGDPELAAYNRAVGVQRVAEGANVYFKHVDSPDDASGRGSDALIAPSQAEKRGPLH